MSSERIHFWAKTTADGEPGISVRDHCLNVGCVAEALLAGRLPISSDQRGLVVWLAACHDLGKISPRFQGKCGTGLAQQGLTPDTLTRAWLTAEGDHSKITQFTLQHLLREQFGLAKSDAALWAAVADDAARAAHRRYPSPEGGVTLGQTELLA